MATRLILRMTTPVAVICALLLGLGGMAAWYVHRLQKTTSDLLARNVAGIRAAEELEIGIRDLRANLYRFEIDGDQKQLDSMPGLFRNIDPWLQRAEALAEPGQQRELMREVRAGYDQLKEEFKRLDRLDSADERRRAVHDITENLISRRVLEPGQRYLDRNEEIVERTGEENQQVADHVAVTLLLLGVCGSVAGLLAGFGIARSVSQSIVQLHVPIRDAQGKLEEVIGPFDIATSTGIEGIDAVLRQMAHQVTTVVRRLQQSEREALRAEQLAAVGQLSAGLAHEMRNPLMAMKMIVQAAVEQGEAGKINGRKLLVLDEEIKRQEKSINLFLDFARAPKLEAFVFDLRKAVEPTFNLVRERASRQGVQLHWKPPLEPVLVRGDEEQFRQVLLNLMINALDEQPEGGDISVILSPQPSPGSNTTSTQAAPQTWAIFRVADAGPGLPIHLGNRIFEPYISTKETGMGLGLSISKRIVEAHGGYLSAANGHGKGAVFTIRLPLAAAADRSNSPGDQSGSLAQGQLSS